jgi:hypothetical protein
MQDKAPLPGNDGTPDLRPDGLTPAEAATQRKLKAIVLGLGVLIMLALAGVIVGMVYRASQIGKTPNGGSSGGPGGKPPAMASPVSPGQRGAPPFLADVKLALPPGSVLKSATLQGTVLVVHHDGPAGAGITLLDLTSGQIVSRITVDVPAR